VLNAGLHLPEHGPGVTLTSSPGFDNSTVARQLLRTGVFDVPLAASPLDALRDALAIISPATQGSLWLAITEADEDGPALLSVRCRKATRYSLHTSLKRYDRLRPGILGGLLNALRMAARLTAPMFTPYDALQEADVLTGPFDPRYDTLDEAESRLRYGQYKALPEPERNRRLNALSPRDAARLMAKDGRQTYLEDHKLGWTLGKPLLSGEELEQELTALPADLKVGVERLNRCLRQLAGLSVGMPPDLDDPRFEEFGSVTAAFVVTGGHPDRLAKDALCEYHDDTMHQRAHILDEQDSWPLWSVPVESHADYRKVSRALVRTARAQGLVHAGLLALGAQKC
jgi:hypothetical protein